MPTWPITPEPGLGPRDEPGPPLLDEARWAIAERIIAANFEDEVRGLRALGPPVVARIEDRRLIATPIHRGTCYAMTIRFGRDARPRNATTSFNVTVAHTDVDVARVFTDAGAYVLREFCPLGPGYLLSFIWGMGFLHPQGLGTGSFITQVFSRPIDESELQRRAPPSTSPQPPPPPKGVEQL